MHFNSGSSRVTIQDTPDGLDISIPSKFNPNLSVALTLWFVYNYMIGRWIISDLRGDEASYLDLVAVVLWLAVLYWIARAILWSIRGREKIYVRGRSFELRFEMPGIGRTSSFDLSEVEGLRIFPPTRYRPLFLFAMFPDHRGRIIFDDQKKVHAFGVDLSETEAERVIQRINEYRSTLSK